MKRTLLLLGLFIGLFTSAHAQSGGPDQYGYIWRDTLDPAGPDYNWIAKNSLQATEEVSGLSDDNCVGPFFLPSPFPYYWYTVDRYWIGSNGYVIFSGSANISSAFPIIPSASSPQNYLAAMLSDLNFDGAGNPASCWRWQSAAGDSVLVTWDSVPFWQAGAPNYVGANSFQILFNYNDSTITYTYKDQVGTPTLMTGMLTTGIENNSGTLGLMVLQDQFPMPQTAVRFYPPATTTYQAVDASVLYNNNPDNAGLFLSKNGTPFPLESMVRNSGNTSLPAFNVQTVINDSLNGIALSLSGTTTPMAPATDQLITMSNPYTPTTAGAYRMSTITQLPGDIVATNNRRILELQVVDTTQAEIELSYDNGANSGGGISWSGGNAGCSNYFIPPFYPCTITKVKVYNVSDPLGTGYSMMVYDDNGPNNLAGTLLDSVNVAPGTFVTGQFHTTVLNAPVTITSGGFYVTWFMGGNSITLGTNAVTSTVAGSNRGFEVLGGAYSDYRSRETQDLMIRAVINGVTTGTGEIADEPGNIYPNPASDKVFLELNNSINLNTAILQVFTMDGRLVYSNRVLGRNNRIELDVTTLSNGLYTVRVQDGEKTFSRNLNVIH